MKCPKCASSSRTLETRENKNYKRRRRECRACGFRFSTKEASADQFESPKQLLAKLEAANAKIRGLEKFKKIVLGAAAPIS